jgi:anti-sigma factor RsiW
MSFPATDCDRARESFSAQLDGELPEFGRECLEAHLRSCADCSAWAEDVGKATQRLRQASLEVPVASAEVARHGRRLVGARFPAAAATLAAACIVAVLALHPTRLTPAVPSHHAAFGHSSVRLLPQARLERLDGGFVFGVRTTPQRGRLQPS